MVTVAPQELDYAERAPVIVEQRVVIAATPQEVWDTILDYPGWTRWFPQIVRCEATSEPTTGIGSTRVVTLKGKARVEERFIGWEEPRLWAFTAIDAPPVFSGLVERVTLEPLDDSRTEVTYRMAMGPKPFLSPVFKLLKGQFDKNLAAALGNLEAEVVGRRSA